MARYVIFRRRRRQLQRRIFRDRQNPLDYMDDDALLRNFRLDRQTIFTLCAELDDGLRRSTHRNQSFPVSLTVVIALGYYASGSFQAVLGRAYGVTAMSVSRSIHSVSAEICHLYDRYITFPERPREIAKVKQDFYQLGRFPNVIGAVDGTLIPVIAPSVDEHLYVTRKGFHAINVQGICNAEYLFENLVVRWPGCTHDAYVWQNSDVSRHLTQANLGNSWLLGDSAYPLQPHLLTPILAPGNVAERRYNAAHKHTRCIIERTVGLWKMRFRCLHKSGGYLMYSPQRNIKIICATGILHNICIRRKIPLPDAEENDDYDDDDDTEADGWDRQVDIPEDVTGRRVRERLIQNMFAQE